MIKIAPSILSANFGKLYDEVARVAAAGADWIHIDVMDGHFVPNITLGPDIVKAIRPATDKIFDVHLMISEPEKYIGLFRDAGADYITVHAEASSHLHRLLQQIKAVGAKAGVALNPATPLSMLEEIIEEADLILLMTVNPGFGGQKFIERSLHKISKLRCMTERSATRPLIEVDGGINAETARQVVVAGADILVAGSAVYGRSDLSAAIQALRGHIL